MAVKPKKPEKEEEPMHPVARAAWQGYAEYRKEMVNRRTVPAWKELSVKTMVRIAAVLVAGLLVLDFLKRNIDWGGS